MDKKDLFKLLDGITNEPEPNKPTFTKHDRILIIDGLNLFLRNFAVLSYINQSGVHIGGLGGFLRSLGYLINQNKPTSVYIVFDGVGSSINRKNLLPEYKSGRNIKQITNYNAFDSVDDEQESKADQISRLIHYLRCLPVKIISLDKVEADDIIAHLVQHMTVTYNSKCVIVSADKDFLQLVNNNVTVYSPMIKEYYTPKSVKEKFNISPENFLLYKTLLGDSSDKIPGVQGLGPKKLYKLFPELLGGKITLDDIFSISEAKYKENVIYSRVIFNSESIEKNHKLMDLGNPLVDDNEKSIIEELVEARSYNLKLKEFLKLYHEDGLVNVLKNVDYWINDTFKVLSGFNK
jgi:5'-3' exonuclease